MMTLTDPQKTELSKKLSQDTPLLTWQRDSDNNRVAYLGIDSDGARFDLTYTPTCYRRGIWRLNIMVHGGPAHHQWGCFDDADQPTRWYHIEENAMEEAEEIAKVLLRDRLSR